jgi:hypothetical protein
VTRENVTETEVKVPSEAATWTTRATPPPVGLSLDLSPWRPSSEAADAWTIPVPSPFRIEGEGRDQMLRGTPGVPGQLLRPAQSPWMYTDFADAGRGLRSALGGGPEDDAWHQSVPAEMAEAAVRFADRYGLPSQWEAASSGGIKPPEAQPLRDFLGAARRFLHLLRVWKESPQKPRSVQTLQIFIGMAVKDLHPEPVRNDDGSWHLIQRWDRPLSLLQLMELQMASDLIGGREVKECGYCGKLFVWTESPGRQREVRSDARFCSALHARMAAREKRKKG